MKQIIIWLLSCFCLSCVYAEDSSLQPITSANQKQFQQVQTMLSKADNLSGDFKQTRKFALLSSPLLSNGHFALSKKQGLKWEQVKPFKSKLIVTSSKIEQQIQSSPATIITKEEQPVVFSFTNIFLSVFKGNTKAIKNYFTISFAGDTAEWKIVLKPIGAPLIKP